MTPDQPWMWHWGGMWIFPMIMFVIFFIFIISLVLFFGRGGFRPPWSGRGGHYREDGETDSALEILKKRYAKGEITKNEFEQMKNDILP